MKNKIEVWEVNPYGTDQPEWVTHVGGGGTLLNVTVRNDILGYNEYYHIAPGICLVRYPDGYIAVRNRKQMLDDPELKEFVKDEQ